MLQNNILIKSDLMRELFLIIFASFFFITQFMCGQDTKLTIEVAGYGTVASDSLQPLWNYANQWGEFDPMTKAEGVFTGKVYYHFLDKKNVSLRAGVSGVLKTNVDNSFVQEAFLRGKFWWFDLSAGMEAYSPVAYNDELSSGMFLISSNARPVPKITAGIYEYLPLGFTENWVEIRGAMSQGFLGDRGPKGNSDVLLHEKWAYVRLGNVKFKPYAGLVHSALFGGTRPNGTKIPIDFWATFRAKGSAKIGGGEETNAAGAHMGLWDFGMYFPIKEWQGHFYFQKPFADGSGMHILDFRNKDYYIGLYLSREGKRTVSAISFEYIKTSWQCGLGTPDPYDPDERHIVFPGDVKDVDAYMLDRFGKETDGWTDKELTEFLEDEWNYGYEFGGRDDYMNNGMYYAGWTHHSMSMGTPLYHTASQVNLYAPDWAFRNRVIFINNRVNGFHIGLEGWFNEQLFYRFKGTFTNNQGSYGKEYHGRYSWEKTDNYFYTGGKNQFYTNIEVNWKIEENLPLTIIGNIGYDFGELYHSFGGRLGIVYKISPL